MFKQQKHHTKIGGADVAVTKRGYSWRENKTLVWTSAIQHAIKQEDHKLFKKICIHVSRRILSTQMAKRDREILNRKGSLGHCHLLRLQWIFELETDKAVVMQCQSVLSFWCHVHCWLNKGHSQSNSKHKPIVISEAILMVHACRRSTRVKDSLANQD